MTYVMHNVLQQIFSDRPKNSWFCLVFIRIWISNFNFKKTSNYDIFRINQSEIFKQCFSWHFLKYNRHLKVKYDTKITFQGQWDSVGYDLLTINQSTDVLGWTKGLAIVHKDSLEYRTYPAATPKFQLKLDFLLWPSL